MTMTIAVMISSSNGYFDVCNYYYTLWSEIPTVASNDFEKTIKQAMDACTNRAKELGK